jgi:Flp pilus assembly protein TadD
MTAHRNLLALAALALAACATAGPAPAPAARPAPAAKAVRDVPLPPPPGAAAPAPPAASLRGQRLFEQAVAAADEQQKLKIPTDWDLLERRWRTAAEDGGMPEAWFNLGVCQERLGRWAEARSSYQRALELQPAFREAAANLALLSEPEEQRAALGAWSDLLRRHPEDALARARLAALYEKAGQHDEAARLAREALLHDPRSSAALKVLLRVALARGNADLAHLLALRAQKLDPSDPEIPTAIGLVLARQGDEAGAAAQWRKALALRPDWAPARVQLLRQSLAKQHWDGVAEQARALLQSDPADARTQLTLGVALRHQGKADEAARSYDEAEKLSGGRLSEVHLARAVLLARVQERCEPALAELKRYAALAGPAALADGTVGKLERECEQVLSAGRAAEEEARRMKAEADKAAAKGAPSDTGPGKPTP